MARPFCAFIMSWFMSTFGLQERCQSQVKATNVVIILETKSCSVGYSIEKQTALCPLCSPSSLVPRKAPVEFWHMARSNKNQGSSRKKNSRRRRGPHPLSPLGFLQSSFGTLNLSQSVEWFISKTFLLNCRWTQLQVSTCRWDRVWAELSVNNRTNEGGEVQREPALIMTVSESRERIDSVLFVFQEETSEHLWSFLEQNLGLELQTAAEDKDA